METKQRYSDQEVKNLLQILEAEKKCVRNLRKRIAGLESAKSDAEKFRRMVDHYRDKYEATDTCTDGIYKENEKLKTLLQKEREAFRCVQFDLEESSQYIGKLQQELSRYKKGAGDNLKRNLDEAELGRSKALEKLRQREQELSGLRQNLERARQQLDAEKKNSSEMAAEIEGKDRLLAEYERLQGNYQSAIEKRRELEGVIQEETDQLKLLEDANKRQEKELGDAKIHARQLEKGVQYLREKLEETENERNEALENAARDDSDDIKSLKQEIETLKSRLEKAVQMEKDLKSALDKYASLESEKETFQAALEDRDQIIDELENELEEVKKGVAKEMESVKERDAEMRKALEENRHLKDLLAQKEAVVKKQAEVLLAKQEQIQSLESDANEKQKIYEEKEKRAEELKIELEKIIREKEKAFEDKKGALESREARIAQMNYEMQKMRDRMYKVQAQVEEKEVSLKTAQQHLARKMKEMTQIKNTAEEQKSLLSHQNNRMETLQQKVDDQNREIESRRADLNKVEEALESAKRELDKHKEENGELQKRNRELTIIEEKYDQLQKGFAQLGSVFQGAAASEAPPPAPPKPVEPAKPKPTPEPQPKPPESGGDLFAAAAPKRYRQSFFDD